MEKKNVVKGLVALSLTAMALGAQAQFSLGNVAVFQADSASANNSAFRILELGTTGNQASPVNTYAMTSNTGMRASGSATSTGYLSHSNDGKQLLFNAAVTTNTSANINTITTRGVGSLTKSGAFSIAANYTGASGNQARSATTLNGSNYYITDQGGQYTNGSTSASPTTNLRNARAFGGVVYAMTSSTTAAPVGTLSALTGGAYAGLPGLSNGTSSFQDFYLVQSGVNGSTFDVLYMLSATSATVGTINKYSLVGSSWVANGSYATSFGGFGLAARTRAGSAGAELFATSGTGATGANSLIRLTDSAGYNAAISISTGNNVTLFTAGAGTTLKGVEIAPVPEPATIAAFGIGFAAILRRRNRK